MFIKESNEFECDVTVDNFDDCLDDYIEYRESIEDYPWGHSKNVNVYSIACRDFVNQLTDKQLYDLLDSSGDYEFDESNGLLDELVYRTSTDISDYDNDYDSWYQEAMDILYKNIR